MNRFGFALVVLVLLKEATCFVVPPSQPQQQGLLQQSKPFDMDVAGKTAAAFLTASIIATSTLPPPSFAATSTAVPIVLATQKATSLIPAEERAVSDAKSALGAASKDLFTTQNSANSARAADDRAGSLVAAAEKKVSSAKKQFLLANDQLALAKGTNPQSVDIKSLTSRVAEAQSQLKREETELKIAKETKGKTSRTLSYWRSQVDAAEKAEARAKETVKKAEEVFAQYKKRQAEQAKKNAKAAEERQKQQQKADEEKKKYEKELKAKADERAKEAAKRAKDAAKKKAEDDRKIAEANAKRLASKQQQIKKLEQKMRESQAARDKATLEIKSVEAKLQFEVKELESMKKLIK